MKGGSASLSWSWSAWLWVFWLSCYLESFLEMNKNIKVSATKIEAQDRLTISTQHIEKFLSQARPSTVTISQDPGEPPFSKIEFTDIEDRNISIFQEGSNLIQTKGVNRFTVIKDGIERVTFVYPDIHDESKIKVSVLTKQETRGGGEESIGLSTQVIYLEYL